MKVKKDFYTFLIFLAGLFLATAHAWQFYKSGFVADCLIRAILYLSISFVAVFFSRKAIIIECLIFAFVVTWLNDFLNFTGFFVALLSCRFNRAYEKHIITFYVINVSVSYMIQGLMISHLLIHLTTCFIFYVTYFYVNKRLTLSDKEKLIIEELKKGKQQKEIDLFSKNVITQKLKDAKLRNNINTTEELLAVYIQESDLIP